MRLEATERARRSAEQEQWQARDAADLRRKLEEVERELSVYKTDQSRLVEEAAASRQSHETEQQEILKKAVTMETELRRLIDEKENTILGLRGELSEKDRHKREYDKELREAKESHSRLSERLHTLTNDLKQLKMESDQTARNLSKQKDEAEFLLTGVKSAFTAEMNKANSYHQRLQEALAAAEQRQASLTKELEESRAANRVLEQSLGQIEKELERRRGEQEVVERDLRELEAQGTSERQTLREELEKTHAQLDEAQSRSEKLASEVQSAHANVERLSATLEKSEQVLAKENAVLTDQVEALKERLKGLSDVWVEKAALAAKLAKMTARVSRAQSVEEVPLRGAPQEEMIEEPVAGNSEPVSACLYPDGGSMSVEVSADGNTERAAIHYRGISLECEYSQVLNQRVAFRYREGPAEEDGSIELSIESVDHSRALSPGVSKLYRNKAHYFLSRYFSLVIDKPDNLTQSNDALMRALLRLLNQENVVIVSIRHMNLDYSPARVPVALKAFFEGSATHQEGAAETDKAGTVAVDEGGLVSGLNAGIVPEGGEKQDRAASSELDIEVEKDDFRRHSRPRSPSLRDSVWKFLKSSRVH